MAQNAHSKKTRKKNVHPSTRHGNATLLTQVPLQRRDFALCRRKNPLLPLSFCCPKTNHTHREKKIPRKKSVLNENVVFFLLLPSHISTSRLPCRRREVWLTVCRRVSRLKMLLCIFMCVGTRSATRHVAYCYYAGPRQKYHYRKRRHGYFFGA